MSRGGSFPDLTLVDLVDQATNLGCALTEEDIVRPTASKVQAIYGWFMQRFLGGLGIEEVNKATERQLDLMEEAEYYREALTMGTFELTFKQLLQAACVDEFNTRYLTNPDSASFRRTLSGLMNYALYEQEQSREHFDPYELETEAFQQDLTDYCQEEAELDEQIARLMEKRAEEDILVEKGTKENSKLKEILIQKRAVATKTGEESDAVKRATKAKHAKVSEMAQAQRAKDMEVIRLRGRVIQSPERIKNTLVVMNSDLIKERAQVANLEKKERDINNKVTTLTKYQADLGQAIKILDEWAVDQVRSTEVLNRYNSHSEQIETLNAERADYANQLQTIKRRILNSKEELSRFLEKSEKKRFTIKTRIQSLRDHLTSLNDQRRNCDIETGLRLKQVNGIETEIKNIQDNMVEEIERCNAAYLGLLAPIQLYSTKMNKLLDMINVHNAEKIQFEQ